MSRLIIFVVVGKTKKCSLESGFNYFKIEKLLTCVSLDSDGQHSIRSWWNFNIQSFLKNWLKHVFAFVHKTEGTKQEWTSMPSHRKHINNYIVICKRRSYLNKNNHE